MIQIQGKDLTFYETLAHCNGTTQTVMTNKSCEVPMSVLLDTPFSLIQGDLITVRARASNIFGSGAFSDVNTTGVIA